MENLDTVVTPESYFLQIRISHAVTFPSLVVFLAIFFRTFFQKKSED